MVGLGAPCPTQPPLFPVRRQGTKQSSADRVQSQLGWVQILVTSKPVAYDVYFYVFEPKSAYLKS